MPVVKRIVLTETARNQMMAFISSCPKVETGGICLGRCEQEGEYRIESVTGPGPQARQSPASIDFDHEHLQAEQDRLLDAYPGLRFLGDWHYHTRGECVPSARDLASLRQLAHDPDFMLGQAAIILVVTVRWKKLKARCYSLGDDGRASELSLLHDS